MSYEIVIMDAIACTSHPTDFASRSEGVAAPRKLRIKILDDLAAAIAEEAPWDAILSVNIDGTYQVFEAARRQKVARVVFASSFHAVGFHQVVPVQLHIAGGRNIERSIRAARRIVNGNVVPLPERRQVIGARLRDIGIAVVRFLVGVFGE